MLFMECRQQQHDSQLAGGIGRYAEPACYLLQLMKVELHAMHPAAHGPSSLGELCLWLLLLVLQQTHVHGHLLFQRTVRQYRGALWLFQCLPTKLSENLL